MELNDFLQEVVESVETEREARKNSLDNLYLYPDTVFTEQMLKFLSGMGFIPADFGIAYYDSSRYGKISGYAFSEEHDKIDLINTLYFDDRKLTELSNETLQKEANQILSFVEACANGDLLKYGHPSEEIRAIASALQEKFDEIDGFRIYILTNAKTQNQFFNDVQWKGKKIEIEVMDIGRYFSIIQQTREIIINFKQDFGSELPCLYSRGMKETGYDCVLAIIPGNILQTLYEKFGPRLLESNVRSFLGFKGMVNRRMQETMQNAPDKFLAYNNGLVIVSDKIDIKKDEQNGCHYIQAVRGFQVVNGGQTIAGLFYAKKENYGSLDLDKIQVAAKFIIPNPLDHENSEDLNADISFYSQCQNLVRIADLSSTSEFQRRIEELASQAVLSDGFSRVFYERTKGSFNVFLSKETVTDAQRDAVKTKYPVVITKTQLAKYLNSWNRRPWEVAWGEQKNFVDFMSNTQTQWTKFTDPEKATEYINQIYDYRWFNKAIAKTFLFRSIDRIVEMNVVTPSKACVDAYTVALIADKFADLFDLDEIWRNRGLTSQQETLACSIAVKVNQNLLDNHGNSIFTEWAKREGCWERLKSEGNSIRRWVTGSSR